MGDFKITVVNKTGDDGTKGRHVNVMLFQTLPDPLITDSYSTAWKVRDVQYPGTLGPISLPADVEFYVIDNPGDVERQTGPFKVNFGDVIDVTQTKGYAAPVVQKAGSGQPNGEIKVNNVSGNAQPLEMALFKNGSKIVSFKSVEPGISVYLAIKPVIYVGNIENIVEGDDFKAVTQSTNAKQFQLFAKKPNVKIEIRQDPNKELIFSLID